MKEEFKVISKFIEEKSRVLDVGCGDGILMEFLSKNKVVDIVAGIAGWLLGVYYLKNRNFN